MRDRVKFFIECQTAAGNFETSLGSAKFVKFNMEGGGDSQTEEMLDKWTDLDLVAPTASL